MQGYDEQFFEGLHAGSRNSAEVIVPLVLELIRPRRVLDIGCGDGTWLTVFQAHGVEEVLGVDGAYAKSALRIPEEQFVTADLGKPLKLAQQFDLVVSLEVAEHLPAECAETFITSLTEHGSLVLFSAAVPFQGGTDHVNEQWPDYWAAFFREKGYVPVDCIRKKVWDDDRVEWWYAQNVLIFARHDCVEKFPLLKKEFEETVASQLSVVHPRSYVTRYCSAADPRNLQLKLVLRALPTLILNAVKRRLPPLLKSS